MNKPLLYTTFLMTHQEIRCSTKANPQNYILYDSICTVLKTKMGGGGVWEGDRYTSNKRATGILVMMEQSFCILITNFNILVGIVCYKSARYCLKRKMNKKHTRSL